MLSEQPQDQTLESSPNKGLKEKKGQTFDTKPSSSTKKINPIKE